MKLSILESENQSKNKKVIEFLNFDENGEIIEKNDIYSNKIDEINSDIVIQRYIVFK